MRKDAKATGSLAAMGQRVLRGQPGNFEKRRMPRMAGADVLAHLGRKSNGPGRTIVLAKNRCTRSLMAESRHTWRANRGRKHLRKGRVSLQKLPRGRVVTMISTSRYDRHMIVGRFKIWGNVATDGDDRPRLAKADCRTIAIVRNES
jgi:hypothetical protein